MSSPGEERVLPKSRHPMPGSPEPKPQGRPIRSPAQIERDIEARRTRLASTVDALADRLSPKNIAQRKIDQIKDKVTDDHGRLRKDIVGGVAGAVVALLLLKLLRTRR